MRVLYYPDMDMSMDEARRFWAQTTGLEEEQIRINPYQATHNYRSKSKYGTATVGVGNVKLRAQMEAWLNELYGTFKE